MHVTENASGRFGAPDIDDSAPAELCNALAVRQAARALSRHYDAHLAASGLKGTQYSIVSKLDRLGGLTVQALADALVIDRTTLARTVRPLEREGLVAAESVPGDRRRRVLTLTAAGRARLALARDGWRRAQQSFEASYGAERARALRALMRSVVRAAPR